MPFVSIVKNYNDKNKQANRYVCRLAVDRIDVHARMIKDRVMEHVRYSSQCIDRI
jgi:hypothetical protein